MHLHVDGLHHHDDRGEHEHGHEHGHEDGHEDGHGRRRWRWAGWGLAALALTVLARTFYFVDETEYVYVTQFGQPIRLCADPGLGVKWCYQSVRRFDRRLQMYEPPAREILTEDKENLNFQWYVCWRIPSRAALGRSPASDAAGVDAERGPVPSSTDAGLERAVRRFLQAVGTKQAAESRLEERIQASLAAEIGRTRLSQLVSLDREQLQLDAISQRVTEAVGQVALDQFGIEVVDVRLKRFSYPEAVKPAVYAEIRSERERVAVQYRAEGASQKAKIESLADLQRDQLLAQAQREAAALRGKGEAEAIQIFNEAHRQDPKFYELLKTLDTYRAILDDQTTVVLSADSPLMRLLTQGIPAAGEIPAALPSAEKPPSAPPPESGRPVGAEPERKGKP